MAQKFFIKITDKNEWQDLLGKVLFKTFFHFWEWEEFLESQFKWLKFERYLWREQAILSLARVKIFGKEKLISHPFCEYGGPLPLAAKIDGKEFSENLLREFEGTPLKISFHPYLLNYFENLEFPENERETLFLEDIDKKSVNDIWLALDRNRHRSINSALSQNLAVEECQTAKELKDLYSFYVKSLKKHRAIPYPFSFFKFFLDNPQAKILLVKDENKTVGGNVFLNYQKIAHSFLCGFEEKYRKLGAHSLVLWEEIKSARAEGFQTFDFGATRKNSSIGDFKERWGAKPYPISELKNYSGEPRLRKSKLRNIFGLLPPFLIEKLGPCLLKYKL